MENHFKYSNLSKLDMDTDCNVGFGGLSFVGYGFSYYLCGGVQYVQGYS